MKTDWDIFGILLLWVASATWLGVLLGRMLTGEI